MQIIATVVWVCTVWIVVDSSPVRYSNQRHVAVLLASGMCILTSHRGSCSRAMHLEESIYANVRFLQKQGKVWHVILVNMLHDIPHKQWLWPRDQRNFWVHWWEHILLKSKLYSQHKSLWRQFATNLTTKLGCIVSVEFTWFISSTKSFNKQVGCGNRGYSLDQILTVQLDKWLAHSSLTDCSGCICRLFVNNTIRWGRLIDCSIWNGLRVHFIFLTN